MKLKHIDLLLAIRERVGDNNQPISVDTFGTTEKDEIKMYSMIRSGIVEYHNSVKYVKLSDWGFQLANGEDADIPPAYCQPATAYDIEHGIWLHEDISYCILDRIQQKSQNKKI